MKIENLESLNDFLSKIQSENQKLENQLEEIKIEKEDNSWKWQKHLTIKKDDYRKNLPCPRIEINLYGDEYQQISDIGIVYPEYGRGDGSDTFIPLHKTTTTGAIQLNNENPVLPFKGEFHLYSYSKIFRLRMFLTRDNDELIKELFIKEEFKNQINKHCDDNCRK